MTSRPLVHWKEGCIFNSVLYEETNIGITYMRLVPPPLSTQMTDLIQSLSYHRGVDLVQAKSCRWTQHRSWHELSLFEQITRDPCGQWADLWPPTSLPSEKWHWPPDALFRHQTLAAHRWWEHHQGDHGEVPRGECSNLPSANWPSGVWSCISQEAVVYLTNLILKSPTLNCFWHDGIASCYAVAIVIFTRF